jgi:hypothetical protein
MRARGCGHDPAAKGGDKGIQAKAKGWTCENTANGQASEMKTEEDTKLGPDAQV